MRNLSQTDKNEFTIQDSFNNTLTVFHRMPTITERIRFSNELYKIADGKIIKHPEAYFKYGMLILSGLNDGDFHDNGKEISSDPESPNYRADWKKLIESSANEIPFYLGQKIFESTTIRNNGDLHSDFTEKIEIGVDEAKKKIGS